MTRLSPPTSKAQQSPRRDLGYVSVLILLISLCSTFGAAQLALITINRSQINTGMAVSASLDYTAHSTLQFAPLAPSIIKDVIADAERVVGTPQFVAAEIPLLEQPIVFQLATLTPVSVLATSIAAVPTSAAQPLATSPALNDGPGKPQPTSSPSSVEPPNTVAPPSTAPAVASASPVSTPTPVDTATPVSSPTPLNSPTPLPTATPTAKPFNTATPTATPIPIPSVTPTPSAIPTSTATPRPTSTAPPANTPEPTTAPTQTQPTVTATDTATPLPPPMLAFFDTQPAFLESETVGRVLITLSRPSLLTVTVEYTVSPQTAEAQSDYQPISGTIMFAPNQVEQVIEFSLVDDVIDEPSETLWLTLRNPIHAVFASVDTIQLTILDNDAPPLVQLLPSERVVSEAAPPITLTATLSLPSALTVTADYETVASTATAGLDFVAASGRLIFPPGQLSTTLTITLLDDSLVEPNEQFMVRLTAEQSSTVTSLEQSPRQLMYLPLIVRSGEGMFQAQGGCKTSDERRLSQSKPTSPSAVCINPETAPRLSSENQPLRTAQTPDLYPPRVRQAVLAEATITLVSDDVPQMQFSQAAYQTIENRTRAFITVTLNRPPILTATARLTISGGTALEGIDYLIDNPQLEFLPAQVTQTLALTVVNDLLQEANETVQVSLNSPVGATLGLPQSASLTILDDDSLPQVAFSQAIYQVDEESGLAVVTTTLTPRSSLSVTVDYLTMNGTAVAGQDYLLSQGRLVFEPVSSCEFPCAAQQTFTIPILADNLAEADETVQLRLQNATHAQLSPPTTATLMILDNDVPPTIQFSQSLFIVNEVEPSAVLTVTLSKAAAATTTVQIRSMDGTTSVGQDYLPLSQTLSFSPGQTRQSVLIAVIDDTLHETVETLQVQLSQPDGVVLGGIQVVPLKIVDNDFPPLIRWSRPSYAVLENQSAAIVTMTLNTASGLSATIDYQTAMTAGMGNLASAGQDYQAVSGTVTIPAGQLSQTVMVPLLDDSLVEGNERFAVSLSHPKRVRLSQPSTTTVIIQENDSLPQARLSITKANVIEGQGALTVSVIVTPATLMTATLAYTVVSATATEGQDYHLLNDTTLNFVPGQTVASFTLDITDDAVSEAAEILVIRLQDNPVNLEIGVPNLAFVTISDND